MAHKQSNTPIVLDHYPIITATPKQLTRLKHAYKTSAHWNKVLTEQFVKPTRKAMTKPLWFPPRGGQHVQWLRCPIDGAPLKVIRLPHHQYKFRCPKTGKIYTGFPYVEVIYGGIIKGSLTKARQAAWAYAITGNKSFAKFASKILVGYGKRYKTYPYHDSRLRQGAKASRSGGHLFEQTLDEASYLMRRIAPAYDLIRPALDAADRHIIEQGLILPILKNIAKNPMGTSNWQSYHNGAMLWGGAVLGGKVGKYWIKRALYDPKNGFLYQMQNGVSKDGVWHEGSWSYQRYTMTALAWTARGAANIGIDLWNNPSLQKMYLIQMKFAMPGGALPRFGDSTHPHVQGAAVRIEPMYAATHDKRLIPLLPKTPGWLALLYGNLHVPGRGVFVMPQGSDSMPGAGDIVMRTNGPAGLSLAAQYGKNTSFHAHYDQLSFVLYGFGQELGVDPGREIPQAYNQPIQKLWYKSTLGHNTVWIDEKDQTPAAGKLLSFEHNHDYAAAVMQVQGCYRGVTQMRLLLLTPTYLLVFDQLKSNKPHRYTWLYHNTGASVKSSGHFQPVTFNNKNSGLFYLKDARQRKIDHHALLHFKSDKVTVDTFLATNGSAELTLANGPKMRIKTRVPMVMLTRKDKRNVWFAAVLRPRLTSKKSESISMLPFNMSRGKNGGRIFDIGSDTIYIGSHYHIRVKHNGKFVLGETKDKSK